MADNSNNHDPRNNFSIVYFDEEEGKGLVPASSSDTPLPSSEENKRWYKKLWFKIFAGVLGALAIIGISLAGFLYWQTKSIVDEFSAGDKQIVVDRAKPELEKEPKKKTRGLKEVKTYLLLGSDVRTATDPTDPGRTDTILLVRLYPDENMASILSLPRDLYILIPGHGEDRINAAYTYGGVPLLISTLREWLGVKIDHFVQIDFESFADLINDLDGAYLPIDQRYYNFNDGSAENNYSDIDLKPGYQKLWGADTLSFVRFRHTDSDFHRAARQQLFLREIGRSVREKKSSPLEIRDLIKTISKGTTSDMDSVSELLTVANTLRNLPAENIVRTVMPGESAMIRGMSVIVPDEKEVKRILKEWDNPEDFISKQEKSKTLEWKDFQQLAFYDMLNTIISFSNQELGRYTSAYKKDYEKKLEQKKVRKADIKKITKKERELIPANPPAELNNQRFINHCIPQKLPRGYYWPETDAANSYKLKKEPTLAAYATKESGNSILWMWSLWQAPTILVAPSDELYVKNKKYNLYWESGKVRMIAWKDGNTVSWITNTLQNELDKRTMIALATSCR